MFDVPTPVDSIMDLFYFHIFLAVPAWLHESRRDAVMLLSLGFLQTFSCVKASINRFWCQHQGNMYLGFKHKCWKVNQTALLFWQLKAIFFFIFRFVKSHLKFDILWNTCLTRWGGEFHQQKGSVSCLGASVQRCGQKQKLVSEVHFYHCSVRYSAKQRWGRPAAGPGPALTGRWLTRQLDAGGSGSATLNHLPTVGACHHL